MIEPQVVTRSQMPYVAARECLRRDQLSTTIARLLAEVTGYLQRQRIAPAGPPLVRYIVVNYNSGEVEIDVGFPVSVDRLPADARVRFDHVPAGRYAVTMHVGHYDTLVDTTAALLEWEKKEHVKRDMVEHDKVTRWGGRVESYVVNPPAEPNPNNWRTEIAILLKST